MIEYNSKFYHQKKKKFVKAGWIDFTKKSIGEFNTSNIYNFSSRGSVEWVRPTYCFDSKGEMIYDKDIIEDHNKGQYTVAWQEENNCFVIIDSDKHEELFIDDSTEFTAVGTSYQVSDD